MHLRFTELTCLTFTLPCFKFQLKTVSVLFPAIFVSVIGLSWSIPTVCLCCIALPHFCLLLLMMIMMLQLMSSPPPSIPGTAAPPFSLVSDWLTDRLTAGQPPVYLPGPRSSLLLFLTAAFNNLRCCCCWSWGWLLPQRILHVWMRKGKGCCRLTKVTEKNEIYTGCRGDSRRRHRRIRALFWMGRGFTLCGRRVWVAEVRNGSTVMFFTVAY